MVAGGAEVVVKFSDEQMNEIRDLVALAGGAQFVRLVPGDSVLVTYQQPVATDTAVRVKDTLAERFPGVTFTILGAGATVVAVARA